MQIGAVRDPQEIRNRLKKLGFYVDTDDASLFSISMDAVFHDYEARERGTVDALQKEPATEHVKLLLTAKDVGEISVLLLAKIGIIWSEDPVWLVWRLFRLMLKRKLFEKLKGRRNLIFQFFVFMV